MEDALDSWIAATLVQRGWTVRIVPYGGYGGRGWVRVLARTVLAAPGVADDDLADSGATAQTHDADRDLADLRGWRSFLSAPVAGTPVEVRVADQVHHVVADRDGYVDHMLVGDLEPGWQDVTLRACGSAPVTAPIQVVVPHGAGVVCDIDDTVMVTRLPRMFVAAWNSLVRRADAREAVPGMARLLHALHDRDPDGPIVYLSTGAWDTAPTVARFLRVHGFPAGTLLLTDWGPTNTGWFRSGPRHKVTQLRRLFHELPGVRWTLVGDDGQHDPRVYAGALTHHPDRVCAVLLRQLTFAEHVLSSPTTRHFPPSGTPRPTREIPVLGGPDGFALLDAARGAGLVA